MKENEQPSLNSYPMAAILYEDGPSFDRFVKDLIQSLRKRGHLLAGVMQVNENRPGSRHCEMLLEDLATGHTVVISEDRGEEARGCRLNVAALLEAGIRIRQSLSSKTDLLLINKFGKMESEGGGLRDLIIDASLSGVPVIIGIPSRNKAAWDEFCGGEADWLKPDLGSVQTWLDKRSSDHG